MKRIRIGIAVLLLVAASLAGVASPVAAATGPYLVKDIRSSGDSRVADLTPVANALFFTAKGKGGRELWMSDGTEAGTKRVKDINPGPATSYPSDLTAVGATLFFAAYDGTDSGVWKSDGTEAGTQLVANIDAQSSTFTSFQGQLYFISYGELWRTDGTSSGTTFVKKVATAPDSYVTEVEMVGDRLFLAVSESVSQLWISDGTGPGTTLVKNVPSPGDGVHTLTSAGGRLFFLRDTEGNVFGPNPAELWTSNGTAAGTKLVRDFVPGDNDYVDRLISAGGRAFFVVGSDLWRSNGSASGTTMVADAVTYGRPLTNVHGSVYFVTQKALWKTDGTAGGISHVSTIVPVAKSCRPFSPCPFPADIYYSVGLGGHLFYAAGAGGLGVELWQTDGSPDNGAGMLGDLRPGSGGSSPAFLTKVGESLYFTANDGTNGRELWRYVP